MPQTPLAAGLPVGVWPEGHRCEARGGGDDETTSENPSTLFDPNTALQSWDMQVLLSFRLWYSITSVWVLLGRALSADFVTSCAPLRVSPAALIMMTPPGTLMCSEGPLLCD